MICKKTCKNQIILPKRLMEKFGDVEYFEAWEEWGAIVLTPAEIKPRASIPEIREKIASLGLKEEDIDDAISWARKK